VRYFETTGADGAPHGWWFGGGADLTPFYPRLEDVRHFHEVLAGACDNYDERLYPVFKAWCDRYFFLRHRNETRGVGGVFFDYLDGEGFGESDARSSFEHPRSFEELLAFARDLGGAFCEAYFPIVRKRRHEPFGDRERTFQLLRRGRYVEFNLLYDRGTAFGLQSGGRTESILVSLPPLVSWEYEGEPARGTREAELQAYLSPRDWFAEDPFAS
jgi:coproporphyrinogen III oxidase